MFGFFPIASVADPTLLLEPDPSRAGSDGAVSAVAGDVIGSVFEWEPVKSKRFALFCAESRFTDDTVLTCAVGDALLHGRGLAEALQDWFAAYPNAGYGQGFHQWASQKRTRPYGSAGNGSAMRVSACGWLGEDLDAVRALATASALPTHDHPDGVTAACAVAEAVFLARTGATREEIGRHVTSVHGYDLSRPIGSFRQGYSFEVLAARSVPQAIRCFLEATDWEDAVRNAVSLGGDSDTQAAIAGAIAEAYFGDVPEPVATDVRARLDDRIRGTLDSFRLRVRGRAPLGVHRG